MGAITQSILIRIAVSISGLGRMTITKDRGNGLRRRNPYPKNPVNGRKNTYATQNKESYSKQRKKQRVNTTVISVKGNSIKAQ